jgi:hypothetical protein
MLGIVVILIGRARDPVLWRWMYRQLSPPQARDNGSTIDNRLEAVAPKGSLATDEFVVVADRLPAKPTDSDGYFPGVRPEDFEAVRDDTLSRLDDRACSLHLFDILNRTDQQTLQSASVGPVSYAQLFRQPNQYRGRLVTVSGIVRRANRIELFPNDFGLTEYYQVWLWPSDNPAAPMAIYCLELPKGFPSGMEVAEQAEVTGFFFKRLAYRARDTVRLAPEVLAKTLRWDVRPVATPAEPATTWPIAAVVGVAALVTLLLAGYVYYQTQPTGLRSPERVPDFEVLRAMDRGKGDADECD